MILQVENQNRSHSNMVFLIDPWRIPQAANILTSVENLLLPTVCGSNNLQRKFVYGNYIDEVLLMQADSNDYYYVHDHLYSPAALLDDDGSVLERYEYDAYGYPHIMNASYESRETSDYSNPYMFTGRELDTLDENGLRIMYYRNRYYDPGTGRFLTCDPLGVTPNCSKPNKFGHQSQYSNGLNLYELMMSSPQKYTDPFGLLCRCGIDITVGLRGLNDEINEEWSKATEYQKTRVCNAMFNPVTGWDTELHKPELFINEDYCCGIGTCKGTVTIGGRCYPMAAVNYWLWGKMRKLCGDDIWKTLEYVTWWKRIRGHLFPDSHTLRWTIAGYHSKIEGVASDALELECAPCRLKKYYLDYHIGWRRHIEHYPKAPLEVTPLPPILLAIN